MCVLYLKPSKRPIWIGPRHIFRDVQADIPRGWCIRCGSEIFLTDTLQCTRCEKEAKKYAYYQKSQSM